MLRHQEVRWGWLCAMTVAVLAASCGGSDSTGSGGAGSAGSAGAGGFDGGADVAPDASGAHTLTVVHGYGSGTYTPGQVVHVWAAVLPWTELVEGWTGDADLLDFPAEWHATLTMPPRDVTLEAKIKPMDVTLGESTFLGSTQLPKTVLSHWPASPKGLVLLLHGTGGSAKMIEKAEERYVALAAVHRGYAVVATEAEEVVAGDQNADDKIRWNPALAKDNVDFANLDSLVGQLRQEGKLAADAPLHVIGMSNGGAMAVSLGAVGGSTVASDFPNLRFEGAVSVCANGRLTSAQVTTTPTAWLLCANDDNDQVSNDDARANSEVLRERGIPTLVDEHPASPLYDQRFMRVPGVDEAKSLALAAGLRAGGFVGDDGLFLVSTTAMQETVQSNPDAFPALTSTEGKTLSEVVNQIRVMQAEHQFYSDWAARALDFLEGESE